MLPSLSLLERIQQRIKNTPNKQGEYKRNIHFCLFLLGYQVGLRISEAINFDLSAESKHNLYKITITKGKKERYVYIPQKVIKELKANN
jgi:integrase